MPTSFKWNGDRVKAEIGRQVDARMNRVGQAIVDEAKRLAPVRTGQLRDSISYKYIASTRSLTISAEAPHAAFVEFGTRRMRAQPFLRPALMQAQTLFGHGEPA